MWIEKLGNNVSMNQVGSPSVDESDHEKDGSNFKLKGMDSEVRWMDSESRAIVVIYHEGLIPRPKSGLWSRVKVLEVQPHNGGVESRSTCQVPREFIYPVTILPPNR